MKDSIEVLRAARRMVSGGSFTNEEAIAVAERAVELEQELIAAQGELVKKEAARRFSQQAARTAQSRRDQ